MSSDSLLERILKLKQIVNDLKSSSFLEETTENTLNDILTSIPAVSAAYEKGRKEALKASKKTVAEGKARKMEIWVDQEGIAIYNRVAELASDPARDDKLDEMLAQGKEYGRTGSDYSSIRCISDYPLRLRRIWQWKR
jgi:hypothetical protein